MAAATIQRKLRGHITPMEAARRLHVGLRTLRRYLEQKRFPNAWQTASKRWWIPETDLEGWNIPNVPRGEK